MQPADPSPRASGAASEADAHAREQAHVQAPPLATQPSHDPAVYDIERLERAIVGLVEQNARLREEAVSLRGMLGDRASRIAQLESELLDANQRRNDVAKRIDELISQLDALDAQLASAETGQEPA